MEVKAHRAKNKTKEIIYEYSEDQTDIKLSKVIIFV
jgi:hypothetical protein